MYAKSSLLGTRNPLARKFVGSATLLRSAYDSARGPISPRREHSPSQSRRRFVEHSTKPVLAPQPERVLLFSTVYASCSRSFARRRDGNCWGACGKLSVLSAEPQSPNAALAIRFASYLCGIKYSFALACVSWMVSFSRNPSVRSIWLTLLLRHRVELGPFSQLHHLACVLLGAIMGIFNALSNVCIDWN